jgi:hypothetical protein
VGIKPCNGWLFTMLMFSWFKNLQHDVGRQLAYQKHHGRVEQMHLAVFFFKNII